MKAPFVISILLPSLLCASPILEGYWESWNNAASIETIVEMHADVINISFGAFEKVGERFVLRGVQASEAALAELVDLAHQKGKKVKLSIGGATYPLSGLLKSSEDAQGMAAALFSYVEEHELDGIDFDIEDYPASHFQVELIENTRALLAEKLLSYTPKAPASTSLPYKEVICDAHSFLDTISIMAYDTYPGYSYESDAEALMEMGIPPEKIVIGLMPGFDDVGQMTSLIDCAYAASFVKEREMGGVMVWDLNRDHQNVTGLGVNAATDAIWHTLHD